MKSIDKKIKKIKVSRANFKQSCLISLTTGILATGIFLNGVEITPNEYLREYEGATSKIDRINDELYGSNLGFGSYHTKYTIYEIATYPEEINSLKKRGKSLIKERDSLRVIRDFIKTTPKYKKGRKKDIKDGAEDILKFLVMSSLGMASFLYGERAFFLYSIKKEKRKEKQRKQT